jgi:hypothetical protein
MSLCLGRNSNCSFESRQITLPGNLNDFVGNLIPDFRFSCDRPNLLMLSDAFIHEGSDMGEKQNRSFQPCFNGFLKVDFQRSRVTSDGGLILVRELDEHLGMNRLIEQHLTDSRRGKNTQLPLADMLRQSVYSRLANYEDVNDAERLSQDPAFRLIGSEKTWDRWAALTSKLQSFETELLTEPENLAGLRTINRELIAKAEAINVSQRVVLDIDSTEIPVYGQQENGAYNGHFESTCYHPLLLFNREGDCAAKLPPRNVHSADAWEELLPEIERQQKARERSGGASRRGLCQTRDLRRAGRAARELRHPHSGEREPGTGHRRVAAASGGTAQYQTLGRVQVLSLPGRELEEGPPSGGQSGASPGRAVPASRLYRYELESAQSGGGTGSTTSGGWRSSGSKKPSRRQR